MTKLQYYLSKSDLAGVCQYLCVVIYCKWFIPVFVKIMLLTLSVQPQRDGVIDHGIGE